MRQSKRHRKIVKPAKQRMLSKFVTLNTTAPTGNGIESTAKLLRRPTGQARVIRLEPLSKLAK